MPSWLHPLCYLRLILIGKSNVARKLHKEEEEMLMTKCTERGPVGRLKRKWKFNMKRGLREGSYGNKGCVNCFSCGACNPTRVTASSFLRFLDHTQQCTTVGRTPLDE